MKRIFIYFTQSENVPLSEIEYAEAPTKAVGAFHVYASISSERIGEIYEQFMKRLTLRKKPDGSPIADGRDLSPCVMFGDLLDVALYRTSAPFVLTRIRDAKTGETDRIERTVTSP